MSFEAQYPGICDECLERIKVGDLIEKADKPMLGTMGFQYRHEICPVDPDTGLRPDEVVCEDCWLVKPCYCD